MKCVHKLEQLHCAYCRSGKRLDMTASDVDDLDEFHIPKPARSWGGPGNVSVLAQDGKPVLIPYSMQYMWAAGLDKDNLTSKFLAVAYHHVATTAQRHFYPVPDVEDRQDIAQEGVAMFCEWYLTATLEERMTTHDDMRKLCYFVGRSFQDYRKTLGMTPPMEMIDEETGTVYGPLEQWASDPHAYKPLLGLLQTAKLAVDCGEGTPAEQGLVAAWAIFDPTFEGRMTRDTKAEPLTDAERKVLQRARERTEGMTQTYETDEATTASFLAVFA